MCGIIGYCGKNTAAVVVLEGLKSLEYRGYDSAGIATLSEGQLLIKKDTGKIDEVDQKQELGNLPGNVAIGHTRWATHGGVTQANAHPHADCHGTVAVVHNGIVENFQELRKELINKGCHFSSETDTEVIPHLIERYMTDGASLEEALRETVNKIKGSYSIVVMSIDNPGKIVATCQDKPLVVGLGEKENFVASDVLSFSDRTNRVVFIDSEETVVITEQEVVFLDSDGEKVEKEVEQTEWGKEGASKQGYDFFMLKEILEQPQTMRQALVQERNQIMEAALDILRANQVVLTACGSSRYAAIIGRYLFSKLGGKFSDVVMASELHYFADSIDKNTLVIAISQSGETDDIIQGIKKAKEHGATVFSIVNRVGSLISRMSDRVIYLNCGPEIAVAATKSFTNQLVIFYLLSFAMMNKFDECLEEIEKVSLLVEHNFQHNGKNISKLARKLKGKKDFYYIARGINFALAAEGALKLKEISYIHAEGMPAGELKHGTLALIEKGTPVVAICPNDYTFDETLSNAIEAKARGAFIIGLSDRYDEVFDEWIPIPQVDEIFYPLVSMVPLQMLAYEIAVARKLDPDKPRNLAKSVTVK